MKVNLISESEFTVQGHGVHTAYREMLAGLERAGFEVQKNGKNPADIVHIHTVGLYAFWKLLFARGKKVVSAHVIPESFIGSLKGTKYWLPIAKWWLKKFYGKADLVLACSAGVAKSLTNDMGLQNVEILYNAIDMRKYEHSETEKKALRKELGFSENQKIILGNGQIQPRKKFDTFLTMAEKMPNTQFIWVGGIPFKSLGADAGKFEKILQNLPKNLIVTGVIPLEDVRKYFVIADVFVLPSTQENHPMAVLEAASAELPILLRDIPEYDDTFRGFVAMAKNDEKFVQELQKILENDEYFEELKKWSRAIKERFSTENMAKILEEKYKKILH